MCYIPLVKKESLGSEMKLELVPDVIVALHNQILKSFNTLAAQKVAYPGKN